MSEVEKLRSLLARARGVISEEYDREIPSVADCIDAALLEKRGERLKWVDHPGGVDATAVDEKTDSSVTIAPEIQGFRWYIKSPGIPVISSAWFDTMEEAKKSAEKMIEAFRKGNIDAE